MIAAELYYSKEVIDIKVIIEDLKSFGESCNLLLVKFSKDKM